MKLSALYPRFEFAQRQRVLADLTPRLQAFAEAARALHAAGKVVPPDPAKAREGPQPGPHREYRRQHRGKRNRGQGEIGPGRIIGA